MFRSAFVLLGTFVLFAAIGANAQTTLFNIPVADTLQKGFVGP